MRRIKNNGRNGGMPRAAAPTAIILGILLLFLMSGCAKIFPSTRDITDFKLISILGADAREDGKLKLTVSAKEEPKPKGGGPESDKPLILTSAAQTVSRAFGNMADYTDKHLYLGHDRYCLVGEAFAKRDIRDALDFFERDANARLDTKLFVVKGDTAEKLLTKASDNHSFAADRLGSMEKDMRKLAGLGMTSVVDISNALDENGTALVRALKLVPLTAHDSSADDTEASKNDKDEETKRFDFDLDGYAIIKDNKLADYLPLEDIAGYNLLNGKRYHGFLEVTAPDGKPVSLQMENARRNFEAEWKDGRPVSLTIKISFKTVLEETHSRMSVEDGTFLEKLAEAQSALITKKVQSVIDKSKETGCDFADIGGALNRRCPAKFSQIKGQWDDIWKTLPVEIEVDSKVASTYNIIEPEGKTT